MIAGSEQIMFVSLQKDTEQLYLIVQPADSDAGDESASRVRRREVSWTSSMEEFIAQTKAATKQKTLALLIDNMVLDYAGIRLDGASPLNTITDDDYVPAEMSSNEIDALEQTAPENPNETERRETVDSSAVSSVGYDCDSVCDKKMADLRMSLKSKGRDASDTSPEKPEEKNGDANKMQVGVAGGIDFFTAGNVAPQLSADYIWQTRRMGLVIQGTLEGDSNFAIGSRSFDTRSGSLALGPGILFNKNRLALALEMLWVFRYFEVARVDFPKSDAVTFVDMGGGIYPRLSFQFSSFMGIFLRTGLEVFPRARKIVVQNGPQKRIGLFHFPVNMGLFIRF